MKLFNALKKYSKSSPLRFHMPGHNGCDLGITTDMDITELSFSDNLLFSDGIICDTEKNIAKAYQVKHSLIVTNGATIAIACAIATAKLYGDTLLVVGEAHKSVFSYARLFDMKVIQARYEDFNKSFNCKFGGIIVTTPNYYGKTYSLDCWKNKGGLLIADCSHGSHFIFSKSLPDDCSNDCDIAIMSWHKTLPTLTGGAVILCNSDNLYQKLLFARYSIHSSSPSYLVMASMDKCLDNFSRYGEKLYEKVIRDIETFSAALNKTYKIVETDDKTRVLISLLGKNAYSCQRKLEKQNVFIETAFEDNLVLIVTPYNSFKLVKLAKILNSIKIEKDSEVITLPQIVRAKQFGKKIDFIDLQEAINKVCASELGIYPPGVPAIRCGDILNETAIRFLIENQDKLFGLIDGKVAVFED